MKSIIRWAGSKRKLLSRLEAMWFESGCDSYIEPFCGSACLFFHIEPPHAVLGDTNEWLMTTYRNLQSDPDKVLDKLHSLSKSKVLYNKIRSYHYSRFSEVNCAAYFLYLNRLCFNGLFRTNNRQIFNVPYSNYKTGSFPDRKTFLQASHCLQKATLCSTDFVTTIAENVKRGDFVYLDPPYATDNTRIFRQYNSFTFGVNDISRLNEVLDYINSIGAKFVLSYGNTSEIQFLEKKWRSERVSVVRNISGFAEKRKSAEEIIFRNF